MKQKVIFIGFQERLHGLPVALVNDETGSTATYDRSLHVIVNASQYEGAMRVELERLSSTFRPRGCKS